MEDIFDSNQYGKDHKCNTSEFPTSYTKPKSKMTEVNSGVTFKNKINKIIINFTNVSRNFDSISAKNRGRDGI